MMKSNETTKKPVKKTYNNKNQKKKNKTWTPILLPDLWPNGKVGAVEYRMPESVAKDLLKSRKGPELRMEPQLYLCKYVDEQCGLLYRCVKVTLI